MSSGIDKTTLIEEITEKHPELIGPLRDHGIVCIRCGEPIWGTLEEVAREKGIVDIDRLVKEMNRFISNSAVR